MTTSTGGDKPVPIAGRSQRLYLTIRDLHNNVPFQIWLVPLLLAVPIGWVSQQALAEQSWKTILWALGTGVVAVVVAWLAWLVNRRVERRQSQTTDQFSTSVIGEVSSEGALYAGGRIPPKASVVVTWLSQRPGKTVDDMLKDSGEVIQKLARTLKPDHVVILVSKEGTTPASDRGRTELEDRLSKLPEGEVAEEKVPVDGGDVTCHLMVGPSLDEPHAGRLLKACRAALDYAEGKRGERGPIVADVNGGTVPASIALYEAATERSIPVTWWRYKPDPTQERLVGLAVPS
ncbi:hypothetical protein [Rhabdothermincola sp.]|uniref:hypothetical protein n=1 Tax=Rhabdothermincola sp. TaxID=2820405 RepID=UPI002FE2E476